MNPNHLHPLFAQCFPSMHSLQKHRVMVHRQEMLEFWDSLSLVEKERMLYIHNWSLLTFIGNNIGYFISNKKYNEWFPSYNIKYANQIVLSIYDCIVFRTIGLEKEERELISSFLLVLKNTPTPIVTKVHEVISNDILQCSVIKVKASYISRVVNFMEKYIHNYLNGEKYVLEDHRYDKFVQGWIQRRLYKTVPDFVRDLFLLTLVLLENQIVRTFVGTLSAQQINRRRYMEPVKVIKQPKLKSLSTSTASENFHKHQLVNWDSLKVELFRIKYRVERKQQGYFCYRTPDEASSDQEQMSTQEDININKGFQIERYGQYL